MERAKEGGRERAWHLEIAATRYHGNQTKLMIRPMYDIVPSLCILVVLPNKPTFMKIFCMWRDGRRVILQST